MYSDPTLFEISTPKGDYLEPPPSSHSITTSSYELRPDFIAVVREQSFSGDKDESPYSHLREFEQLCSCLMIARISQDTLKWKLFPFSLTGRAKQWYSLNVRSMEGDWESLWRGTELICFEQGKTESLGVAWERFVKTVESGPDLGIAEPILLQHFRDGLGPESGVFLDSSSERSFTHLTLSWCKDILGKILENTPYTGIFDKFSDEEEEPMPNTIGTKTHRGGTHSPNYPICGGLRSSNKNMVN
jgi:hypothetical protein